MSPSDLVDELQEARLEAPPELRARVRAIAASAPPARRPLLGCVRRRRAAPVSFLACLAPVARAAMIQGLVSSGTSAPGEPRAVSLGPTEQSTPPPWEAARQKGALQGGPPAAATHSGSAPRAAAPAPGRRLVDYRVRMRLRVDSVDDLSRATVRAMRIARRLGGYVVNVDYGAARRGSAVVVLRVPTRRIQPAVMSFSALGTILSQRVSLTDLQQQFNRQVERIGKLRTQIARIERRLAEETLTDVERLRLQDELGYRKSELAALVQSRQATHSRGRFATAYLELVTRAPKTKVVPPPPPPGRLDRALDDAVGILVKELVWALYVLVVAAPLLVLALIVTVAARVRRRQTVRRLLARPVPTTQ